MTDKPWYWTDFDIYDHLGGVSGKFGANRSSEVLDRAIMAEALRRIMKAVMILEEPEEEDEDEII